MELMVPGQWFYDEETGDMVLRSNAFDNTDPMNNVFKGAVLLRLPGTQFTPVPES